jgi:DNA-binding transcriptional LysR family regulator
MPRNKRRVIGSQERNDILHSLRLSQRRHLWLGIHQGGRAIQVDVDGPLALDSQELMVDAAAQGVGLAYVWEDRAAPYIADGRLRYCLEDWCTTEENLFLYFPSRKHQSAGLRALIEAIRA